MSLTFSIGDPKVGEKAIQRLYWCLPLIGLQLPITQLVYALLEENMAFTSCNPFLIPAPSENQNGSVLVIQGSGNSNSLFLFCF
ncbi:hypothetical protein JHK82_028925 [Glycine max]|uniref:Uncharacterized protein n=2 Tax=Glycine subgen. Soja TaxID=1462606 RepID=A0A0R0HXN2_SOYBN|nr:hypothetical protein JHK85_029586 [Glycine max]RZB88602.1 hypothetical protein D0Y65_027830 [Glycine soja]KAG5004906.1 hypothetical protein JHK86_029045 [Glycine max]KAG5128090.1 hypothetical protein JHK82_028925 [Glycine max]KAG5152696.1 hypothetical protein JHK84_029168 [Glycine max]